MSFPLLPRLPTLSQIHLSADNVPLDRNVTSTTFTLKWNVMPHVGILAYGDEARTGELEVPKKVVPVIEEGARRPRPEKMWF